MKLINLKYPTFEDDEDSSGRRSVLRALVPCLFLEEELVTLLARPPHPLPMEELLLEVGNSPCNIFCFAGSRDCLKLSALSGKCFEKALKALKIKVAV